MEQVLGTPNKFKMMCESSVANSPKYDTPVKRQIHESRRNCYNTTNSFNVLPNHITPPSGLTKFIARNPFEAELTNRLHLSMISPTVFSKVVSPSKDSPGFKWSVEELALIQPAKIEEFPIQQTNCIDPEIEVKAQAAITKFFDENQIIPSPWDVRRKETNKINIEVCTPTRPTEDLNLTKDSFRSKKDGWCQTVLSFPSVLPPEVEEVLKPYLTFTQEQNVDNDDANSSNNSSLRRKLFFNHEDAECDDESSASLSPVKMSGSFVLSSSPPQSGMLIYGTPLKRCPQKIRYNHGTPVIYSENISPPDMSPICSTDNDTSLANNRSRLRSVTRLEFTMDYSMDNSMSSLKNSDNNSADTAIDVPATKTVDKIGELTNLCNDYKCMNTNVSFDVEMISKDATITTNNKSQDCNNQYTNIISSTQCANMQLGISSQMNTFNSAQDTGYQTCSINNTTNMMETFNNSPIRQKHYWGEQMVTSDDDMQLLDWKENMKNVFSSTPSKCNKGKFDNKGIYLITCPSNIFCTSEPATDLPPCASAFENSLPADTSSRSAAD